MVLFNLEYRQHCNLGCPVVFEVVDDKKENESSSHNLNVSIKDKIQRPIVAKNFTEFRDCSNNTVSLEEPHRNQKKGISLK